MTHQKTTSRHSRGDILIVDDTLHNLRLLRAMLIEHGYKARGVPSGAMALEVARTAPPDLILLDINMPNMTGYEVCQALKSDALTSGIPVIFISAAHEVLDKVRAFSVGGVDYITKPFQMEEVLARVENQLTLRHLQQDLKHANEALEQRVAKRTSELRQSEEKNRILVENAPYCIHQINLEGTFTSMNQAGLAMMHFESEADIIGMPYLDSVSDEDKHRIQDLMQAAFEGTASGFEFRASNGCFFQSSFVPIHDEEGTVIRLMGLTQDITQRKQAEQERETFIEKLETQNAELERYAYTVSHDLKNPLLTIKIYLGLLERDITTGHTADVASFFQQLNMAANKMQHLLEDLLELSRIGRLMNPSEEISLTDLACDAIASVTQGTDLDHTAVEIAPSMPLVSGDRIRLQEVFQNLIDNALKFMGDQPNPRIEIGLRNHAEQVVYFVQDNGIGIEQRFHKKIFDLFEKLDATSPDTGIGLALAKRIIEVHGGHLWVESEGLGTGATFCFTLPQNQHALDPAR